LNRFRLWLRVIAATTAVMAFISNATLAQEGSGPPDVKPVQVSSIPAARQADRIVVITVEGAIDATTAVSVKRRLEAAERAGFDGMVLEVNSPGGDLGACLEISQAIKSSSIRNTVAWVNDEAHSGGAIISLACREIVTSDPSSFGDALIILVDMFGLTGMQTLTPEQRTKALPPLMADVVDSARRSGYDEFLVQAIVTDGIELWQVEDVETGERLAISENEYRMLFDGEPARGRPMLAQVTGGVRTYQSSDRPADGSVDGSAEQEAGADAGVDDEDPDAPAVDPGGAQDPQGDPVGDTGGVSQADGEGLSENPGGYIPASETLEDVQREFGNTERALEFALEVESERVVITPEDRGRYRLVGYICDGTSAIVMRTQDMRDFGFSTATVQNDEELKAFFGAEQLVRTNENVFEKLVRFLTNPIVKLFLIIVFLLALGIEMLTAGTGIAGGVAVVALIVLLGSNSLIGLSSWWEVLAIVCGLLCLAVELFVMPGFGVFGVIGFLLVFVGLIGTFVSAGGSMSSPKMQQQLITGSVVVLLAFVSAGVGWWLIIRNAQNLPLFDRLILSSASGVGGMPQKSMLHAIVMDDGSVKVGSEGVTTTPLYPIGQADFDGQIEDVHSAFGPIERGVRVRVVSATRMRIEVEEISEDGSDAGAGPAGPVAHGPDDDAQTENT
jgi:membrane-bound serine protease (ClpP class)